MENFLEDFLQGPKHIDFLAEQIVLQPLKLSDCLTK